MAPCVGSMATACLLLPHSGLNSLNFANVVQCRLLNAQHPSCDFIMTAQLQNELVSSKRIEPNHCFQFLAGSALSPVADMSMSMGRKQRSLGSKFVKPIFSLFTEAILQRSTFVSRPRPGQDLYLPHHCYDTRDFNPGMSWLHVMSLIRH